MNNTLANWIQAFRLRTLPLALSSIAMGGFLAASAHAFRWSIFLLCVLTTIFLQVLSNLANDYGDSVHGADSADRKGPSRAVQTGAISSVAMKNAMWLFAFLSLASGIALLLTAFGFDWNGLLFFLMLGILSIGAAIAYTVGRKPYGYAGLGDLSVFIFFGLVGVLGSYYLFAKSLTALDVLPAISCGLFSVGVLNINNIRDIESDLKAGKYSIPVRIGRKNAILYHWIIVTGGLIAALLYTIARYESPFQFIFLLTLPLFVINLSAVSKKDSTQLDPYLKQLALSTLLFVVLFGTGLLFIKA
jgi:1,4-dihydroxy-2-naphthoate polyprenyltransferase